MKGKKVLLAMVFCLATTLIGCEGFKDSETTMEKVQKQLMDMESYSCDATITRISNKGENTYGTKQYYKNTGEYRLEMTQPANVAGNYTVYDGKIVYQFNPQINSGIAVEAVENQARNELFLGQFVKNYLQSEDVAVETSTMEEGVCTVLEAVIPGNFQYTATEKLWIDNKTLKPVQFIIYDKDGKERYITTYNEFEYNPTLDENLFKIPTQ
ncbi:MAG: hypothetical protein ACRCW1_08880 [Anaerotignaceae bacterium]